MASMPGQQPSHLPREPPRALSRANSSHYIQQLQQQPQPRHELSSCPRTNHPSTKANIRHYNQQQSNTQPSNGHDLPSDPQSDRSSQSNSTSPSQKPWWDEPAARHTLHDLTTKVLPFITLGLFMISGTVVLVYSLAFHHTISVSLALVFTGLIGTVLMTWAFLSAVKHFKRKHRLKGLGFRDGEIEEARKKGVCPAPEKHKDFYAKMVKELFREEARKWAGPDLPEKTYGTQFRENFGSFCKSFFRIEKSSRRGADEEEQGITQGDEAAFLETGATFRNHAETSATFSFEPAPERISMAGGLDEHGIGAVGGIVSQETVVRVAEVKGKPSRESTHSELEANEVSQEQSNPTKIITGIQRQDQSRGIHPMHGSLTELRINNPSVTLVRNSHSGHYARGQAPSNRRMNDQQLGNVQRRGAYGGRSSSQSCHNDYSKQKSMDSGENLRHTELIQRRSGIQSCHPEKTTSSSTTRNSWNACPEQDGFGFPSDEPNTSRPVSAISDRPADISDDIGAHGLAMQLPATAAAVHRAATPAFGALAGWNSAFVDNPLVLSVQDAPPSMKRIDLEPIAWPEESYKRTGSLRRRETVSGREGREKGQSVRRMAAYSKRRNHNPQLEAQSINLHIGRAIIDPVVSEKSLQMALSQKPKYVAFSKPVSPALAKEQHFAMVQDYLNNASRAGDNHSLPKPAHYQQDYDDYDIGGDGVSRTGSVDPDVMMAEVQDDYAVSEMELSVCGGVRTELDVFRVGRGGRNASMASELIGNDARPDSSVFGNTTEKIQQVPLRASQHFESSSRVEETSTSHAIMKAGPARGGENESAMRQLSPTSAQTSNTSRPLRLTSRVTSTEGTLVTEQGLALHEDAASMNSCEVRTRIEHEAVSEDHVSSRSKNTMILNQLPVDYPTFGRCAEGGSSSKSEFVLDYGSQGKLKELVSTNPIYNPCEIQHLTDEDQSVFIEQSLKKQQSIDSRNSRKQLKLPEAGLKSTSTINDDSVPCQSQEHTRV